MWRIKDYRKLPNSYTDLTFTSSLTPCPIKQMIIYGQADRKNISPPIPKIFFYIISSFSQSKYVYKARQWPGQSEITYTGYFFTTTRSTVPLSHRRLTSTGISHNSSGIQDNKKRTLQSHNNFNKPEIQNIQVAETIMKQDIRHLNVSISQSQFYWMRQLHRSGLSSLQQTKTLKLKIKTVIDTEKTI